MEQKPNNIEELFQKVKTYADVRLNLLKLQAIDKISGFISTTITMVVITILFLFILVCLTIGLALVLGHATGSAYIGFFIVAGIYIILGLILFLLRKQLLKTPISNTLIKSFFK